MRLAGSNRTLASRDHEGGYAPDEVASGVRIVGTPVAGSITQTGYTRVRYVIEARSAVLELHPSNNASAPLAPLPDTRQVDVNAADPVQVARDSRVVCACPACSEPGESCSVCAGAGRVDAWIGIRQSRHYHVVVQGEGPARQRHPHVNEAADFDRNEYPNTLVHQAWYAGVPAQLAPSLRPQLKPNERVQFVHVQVFIG